jgi:hypothetical protein
LLDPLQLQLVMYKVCTPHHHAGVGKKSSKKVKEVLREGRLARNVVYESDDVAQAIKLFSSIWGIGGKKAASWAVKGLRSLEDLRTDEDEMAALSSRERAGLRHFEDLQQRITREVQASPRCWLCTNRFILHSCTHSLMKSCLHNQLPYYARDVYC